MTVDITWAKDKRDITTHNTQTKTFNSEEQAIEWIRRNAKHIVSINHRGFFYEWTDFSFWHYGLFDKWILNRISLEKG